MFGKSSCPKECGPRGDVAPTLKTDEEPADLTPKPHYSCFKSSNSSGDNPDEEVENTTSGKSEKETDDTSCDKPKEEAESTSCESKPEEEEVEDIKATSQDDEDGKQKRKEHEHSSLFDIADTKSGDFNRLTIPDSDTFEDPTSKGEKLVQGAKIRTQKSPRTKSPRELLQAAKLPPATSQQVYNDHIS